jgi:hypothetical protein
MDQTEHTRGAERGLQYPPPSGTAVEPEPPPATYPPPPTPGHSSGSSLIARAKAGDQQAMATMFGQFLPPGEEVVSSHYLGVLGFWGLGTHSFGAVTPRRFASLRISLLGGVHYQDGSLEYVNSAAVFQPSKVTLYLFIAAYLFIAFVWGLVIHVAVSIVLLLLALVLLPISIKLYYRFKKSGLVVWVREGLALYAFIDRKRMRVSNELYRECMNMREERLRRLGHP